MREPKFKVGDRVRVMRASTKTERDLWGDSWIKEINEVVGKVLTIDCIYCDGWQEKHEYCKYGLEEGGFAYPEFVLQSEIRVGQQLLFSFAKE